MWVFGYGSLTWKADFPYEERIIGFVKGFERKFYQYSTDHRGIPSHPGRVVTLIPASDECHVWGVAFRIKKEEVQNVVDYLDYREKGGYKRMMVLFYPKSAELEPVEILVYVGTKDNVNYAGEADNDSIAQEIVDSIGPSGSNVEYLCNLANTMREIAPHVNDHHLFDIETRVLHLLDSRN